jgi:hypothetical protein
MLPLLKVPTISADKYAEKGHETIQEYTDVKVGE